MIGFSAISHRDFLVIGLIGAFQNVPVRAVIKATRQAGVIIDQSALIGMQMIGLVTIQAIDEDSCVTATPFAREALEAAKDFYAFLPDGF